MLTWPAKDPAATYDYRWQPPLDAGDKLASASVTLVSGDVEITSQIKDDTGLTVVLSAGSIGQNLFRGVWTSAGGRNDEEYIAIEIRDDGPPFDPRVAQLKQRYPAFSGVSDDTIAYWLNDSARFVDESWPIEGDRAPAMLAIAAHNMVRAGVSGIAGSDVGGFAAAGVTDFKSGTFSARFSDDAVKQAVAGGLQSSPYGQEYADLLARNKSGGGVTSPGTVSCGGWPYNGYAGLMGYPARLFPC